MVKLISKISGTTVGPVRVICMPESGGGGGGGGVAASDAYCPRVVRPLSAAPSCWTDADTRSSGPVPWTSLLLPLPHWPPQLQNPVVFLPTFAGAPQLQTFSSLCLPVGGLRGRSAFFFFFFLEQLTASSRCCHNYEKSTTTTLQRTVSCTDSCFSVAQWKCDNLRATSVQTF